MQESWGNGGEDMNMSTGQWDAEDGDMWNSPTSQESSSSCNSWGNGPKKGPSKVRQQHLSKNYRQTDGCHHNKYCCCKKNVIFLFYYQAKMGSKPDEAWIMNRLIKQLTDMGFPVCGTDLHEIPVCAPQFTHDTFLQFDSSSPLNKLKLVVGVSQRDPAEEALKSNNMNLDQAMSKFTSISSLSSLLPGR